MNLSESVDRILSDRTRMTDRFYERFFERCPEARSHFEKVDLQAQSVMLTMALGAIRDYPDIKGACKSYLQVLGTRHKRVGVPPTLYPAFVEALLATLQEFHGSDWDDALAAQWSGACQDTIELMFEGYEDAFHV